MFLIRFSVCQSRGLSGSVLGLCSHRNSVAKDVLALSLEIDNNAKG
jgi:hypothetical protein